MASWLPGLISMASVFYTFACPSGYQNEKAQPLGLCSSTEPKCPPNSYCYPLHWKGYWQYQWVCCPNATYVIPPPPPLFPQPQPPPPLFPQPQPPTVPGPPGVYPIGKRPKGVAVSIPLNDAARQQVPYAMMNLVQEQIQKYPIIIFSLSTCPWCRKAKELFDDFYPNVPYYYFDYDLNPDGNPIANAAMGVSGMRTVPMIYVCQQLIGGFTDLQNLHVAHELQSRIERCSRI